MDSKQVEATPRAPGTEDTLAVDAVAEVYDEVLRVVVPDVELVIQQDETAV